MTKEDTNYKLSSLLNQHPDAEIVIMVNNNEIADPTLFEHTKHRIKSVEYTTVIELESGRIYTSIEHYIMDFGNEIISEDKKRAFYPAIVITTEAGI